MDVPPLPNFVVVGAPRSGTTSLWHYLRAHPDVFMAPSKELRFFNSDAVAGGLDEYRANFKGWRGERAVGEASPQYMYSTDAMRRMVELLPDARLIVVLRSPVDRAYSDYWLRAATGQEHRSFPEVIAAGGSVYVKRGRYLPFLQQVCELYPRAALRIELFEELVGSPGSVYRSVCEHLGVAPDFVPPALGKQTNSFVRFRSLRFRKFHRRLPDRLRKVVGRLNATKDEYPEMDGALRTELHASFRDDNERLANWLGRDLSAWDQEEQPATRS